MNLTFTVKNEPECRDFLKIRNADGTYQTIDLFIEKHPNISDAELDQCFINYRNTEKTYKQYVDDYVAFSESMRFVQFIPPQFIIDQAIMASIYFIQKASECLQFARFFTMKSALILDMDFNIHWSQGYVPQFYFRCIYFGTAATWYSNAFDHVLQAVYWGKKLYTSVINRDDVPYDKTWDVKETMKYCTYEYVVGELKNRGQKDLRKHLTSCSSAIEKVRTWANYIKHKGGIDYKYLTAEKPFQCYFVPQSDIDPTAPQIQLKYQPPDEKYEIKDFKSPIEIDIDDEIKELAKAHTAIYECIEKVIADINFEQYVIKIGGTTNGQTSYGNP